MNTVLQAKPVLLTALFLCLFGCTGRHGGNVESPASEGDAALSTLSNSDSKPGSGTETPPVVAARIVSWADLQAWVASQRGKVVVVDVWSTYCLECMKEFPHFLGLHERFRDQVACASLSVDFYGGDGNHPESVKPQVLKFLKDQHATTTNFISKDADTKVLREIATAAIPAALVYDQQGNLQKVFNNDENEFGPNGFTYAEHIIPYIEGLIQAWSK